MKKIIKVLAYSAGALLVVLILVSMNAWIHAWVRYFNLPFDW